MNGSESGYETSGGEVLEPIKRKEQTKRNEEVAFNLSLYN